MLQTKNGVTQNCRHAAAGVHSNFCLCEAEVAAENPHGAPVSPIPLYTFWAFLLTLEEHSDLQFLNFHIHQSLYPRNSPAEVSRQAWEILLHRMKIRAVEDLSRISQQGACDEVSDLLTLGSLLLHALEVPLLCPLRCNNVKKEHLFPKSISLSSQV